MGWKQSRKPEPSTTIVRLELKKDLRNNWYCIEHHCNWCNTFNIKRRSLSDRLCCAAVRGQNIVEMATINRHITTICTFCRRNIAKFWHKTSLKFADLREGEAISHNILIDRYWTGHLEIWTFYREADERIGDGSQTFNTIISMNVWRMLSACAWDEAIRERGVRWCRLETVSWDHNSTL